MCKSVVKIVGTGITKVNKHEKKNKKKLEIKGSSVRGHI